MYPWHVIDENGRKLAGFNNEAAAIGFVAVMQKTPDAFVREASKGWSVLHDDV